MAGQYMHIWSWLGTPLAAALERGCLHVALPRATACSVAPLQPATLQPAPLESLYEASMNSRIEGYLEPVERSSQ